MEWNSVENSERHLRRLVELGGVVTRLPSGELVGKMEKKEVGRGRKPKNEWQFKVSEPGNCWIWLRGTSGKGYGAFPGGPIPGARAHRKYFMILVGPIEKALVLDHLCRMPACVNPAHLEPVSNKENILRGFGMSAMNSIKTACKRGHLFTQENTRYIASWRACRECQRMYGRKAWIKSRLEAR